MATVFEARLIGNIGRDATVNKMDKGVIAINFPVAHNKNWRDKSSGENKSKTTWVNCTIWKKEGGNLRILDFLKSGTLVELTGTPFAKAFVQEDGFVRSEIRLNVSKTNILRLGKPASEESFEDNQDGRDNYDEISDFTIDEDDF
jgi:single stranded DNA-binding protein